MLCKEHVCGRMPLNEATGFPAKQSGKREMNGNESESRVMLPETKSFLIVEVLLFIMIILIIGTFHSVACDS